MNRRNFLGLVGAGLAVAAFDPHRVIFDMGRKPPAFYPVGRVDFLDLSHWGKPGLVRLYGTWEFDGIYPIYNPDGGLMGDFLKVEHRENPNFRIDKHGHPAIEFRRTIIPYGATL